MIDFDFAERAKHLELRPGMWALTKEAYIAQLAFMLELQGHTDAVSLYTCFKPEDLRKPLSDAFAAQAIEEYNIRLSSMRK